jgi:hypothetical protein
MLLNLEVPDPPDPTYDEVHAGPAEVLVPALFGGTAFARST